MRCPHCKYITSTQLDLELHLRAKAASKTGECPKGRFQADGENIFICEYCQQVRGSISKWCQLQLIFFGKLKYVFDVDWTVVLFFSTRPTKTRGPWRDTFIRPIPRTSSCTLAMNAGNNTSTGRYGHYYANLLFFVGPSKLLEQLKGTRFKVLVHLRS